MNKAGILIGCVVAAILAALYMMYHRVLSEKIRDRLEGNKLFLVIGPFAAVALVVHVVASAPSAMVAMIMAFTFLAVESYFSRKTFISWIKNKIPWFRK